MKDHLTIIAGLFVIAILGAVVTATPESFSFGNSQGNLAGAATYEVEEEKNNDLEILAALEEAKNHDKPLLIVTEHEYETLDLETRTSHFVYVTN